MGSAIHSSLSYYSKAGVRHNTEQFQFSGLGRCVSHYHQSTSISIGSVTYCTKCSCPISCSFSDTGCPNNLSLTFNSHPIPVLSESFTILIPTHLNQRRTTTQCTRPTSLSLSSLPLLLPLPSLPLSLLAALPVCPPSLTLLPAPSLLPLAPLTTFSPSTASRILAVAPAVSGPATWRTLSSKESHAAITMSPTRTRMGHAPPLSPLLTTFLCRARLPEAESWPCPHRYPGPRLFPTQCFRTRASSRFRRPSQGGQNYPRVQKNRSPGCHPRAADRTCFAREPSVGFS